LTCKLSVVNVLVRFEYLDLDSILVGEGVRKTPGDEKSLEELASSIARHGVLQPVLVEPAEEEGKYKLLIGERRFRAAVKVGLKSVPAIVLDEPLRADEALEARLVENLQREGLDPLDEAEAYAALKEMGVKVSAIARRVGKSRPYVSKRMRLLRLHPVVRKGVREGTITPGHSQALLRLEPEQQLSLAEQVKTENLSVMETRQRVREIIGKPLKWRLIPIRLDLETFEALKRIAPDGDVKKLIQDVINKMLSRGG